MTAGSGGHRPDPFIATKEHRRFTEFAHAIRKHRTIGLCFGPAGVGKTLSARRHAHWDLAEPLLQTWGPREPSDATVYAALARSRTVFHTPTVGGTLRELRKDLHLMTSRVESCIDQHRRSHSADTRFVARDSIEFIPIKSWAARGSGAPGNCAGHSRAPSRDRGCPPSTAGSGLSQCDNASHCC